MNLAAAAVPTSEDEWRRENKYKQPLPGSLANVSVSSSKLEESERLIYDGDLRREKVWDGMCHGKDKRR